MSRMKKSGQGVKQSGATLLELVVAAGLLALVMAIALSRIMPVSAESGVSKEVERVQWQQYEQVACYMNLRIAQNATEYYGVIVGTYPDNPALLYPRFLDRIPRCPVSGEPYYYDEHHIIHCTGHPR